MKKTYSLALWWWAARWLCHIWVLKYIEENKIEINEISWTSMWAIIWACFAIWMKSEEIAIFAKSLNFLKLIDFNLKQWIVAGKKVTKKLEELFREIKIEDTKIPLKILATNLETGKKEVFTKWKISDAVRASISLPSIFTPHKIWENSYLDWWLTENLPVLSLDWQNIIAVSAVMWKTTKIETTKKIGVFEFKRWFWNLNYQILKKTILTMMSTNEELSVRLAILNEKSMNKIANSEWKNIILLAPEVWNYEVYDFNKVDELVELWYKEASLKL